MLRRYFGSIESYLIQFSPLPEFDLENALLLTPHYIIADRKCVGGAGRMMGKSPLISLKGQNVMVCHGLLQCALANRRLSVCPYQ